MCFIVQGSTFQFDKIKNSLWLLLSKQRYCFVQKQMALASQWLPHFSPHHPLWEHSHSCFSFLLHCTPSMTIFLGLWAEDISPGGDAACPQTCWLQTVLYHFYPRNHHKCSTRVFCKIFQPALGSGCTHSPPSLTPIWKEKENFPGPGHLMERQNQRFMQGGLCCLKQVVLDRVCKSIEYLQCFALYKFSSETSEHNIKCNYTNVRSLPLPPDPVNEKISHFWVEFEALQ